jgi:hypothetical protein
MLEYVVAKYFFKTVIVEWKRQFFNVVDNIHPRYVANVEVDPTGSNIGTRAEIKFF